MQLIILTTLMLLPCLCCGCDEGTVCNTTSVTNGVCVRGQCLQDIPNMDRENLRFTIVARYPDFKLKANEGSRLFIRGYGLGLSWNKGVAMVKDQTNTWNHDIEYKSTIGGYRCQSCADSQQPIRDKFEFRIMIDDKDDMIGANFVIELPLSEVSSYFNADKKVFVYPWFYNKSGKVTSLVVNSPELGGNRTLAVYTPPSYDENNLKTYPVLFVLDFKPGMISQTLFDDPISKYRVAEEYVVIGFGDYNFTERTDFLTPSRHEYFECINGSFVDNCAGCLTSEGAGTATNIVDMLIKCCKMVPMGGKGSNTLDLLLQTAMPAVRTKLNDRLKTDRENVGIAGYSLGGLMACHAAWTRPRDFGFAACQSPSFWWPIAVDNGVASVGNDFLTQTLKNQSLNTWRQPQRIYIDSGGSEAEDPYRMASQAVEVAHAITHFNGYILDENVWLNIYPDAVHSFLEWKLRLWKVLKTLFPSKGNYGIPKTPSRNESNSSSVLLISGTGQCALYILVLLVTCFNNTVVSC